MPDLPAQGEWQLATPLSGQKPPFTSIRLNFQASSGTAQSAGQNIPLTTITKISSGRFGARYQVGAQRGMLEGTMLSNGLLELKFLGSVQTMCFGKPLNQVAPKVLTPTENALQVVEDFRKKTGPGAFPNISRGKVADGLASRLKNPDTLDQAWSSFCGPAAFMYCALKRDPVAFAKYVTGLYDTGVGTLGTLTIRPSQAFRFDSLPSDSSAVDWVALGSLRDSENWIFEYHRNELPFLNAAGGGDSMECRRGGTSASDMVKWFEKTGYTQVEDWTGTRIGPIQSSGNTFSSARLASEYYQRNFRVCLNICANMLGSKPAERSQASWSADHWVVLTSPIEMNGDHVKFQIYTWRSTRTVQVNKADFQAHYYGFVTAGK